MSDQKTYEAKLPHELTAAAHDVLAERRRRAVFSRQPLPME